MLKAFAFGTWVSAMIVVYQNGFEFYGSWGLLLVASNLTTAIVASEG